MSDVPVDDVNKYGVIKESPMYKMPPPAWSVGENVRIVNQGIGAFGLGWEAVLGTPTTAPRYLQAIKDIAQTWWIYMSATKGYVISGGVHTEITRLSGVYTSSDAADWNGTILGGIPIINNGKDVPQFWATYSAAQKFADLTNWPATLRTKFIRALGPYLIAANLSDSGQSFPHRIRWSHPADPGSVPVSWDHTDPSKDSRQVDLPDVDSGLITEMLPLKEAMFVYKGSSIHRLRPTGNANSIFARDTLSEKAGCLNARCVALTGNGQFHVSLASDDLISHDGVRIRTLLTNRWKRYLFNQISEEGLANCFMFPIPAFNEIVFCYPEAGSLLPTRALVWNYSDGEGGAFTELTLKSGIVAAALGNVEGSTGDAWSDLTNTWAETTDVWNKSKRNQVILVDQTASKFYQMDSDTKRDGVIFTSTISREGLPLFDVGEDGKALVNFTELKMFTRLWPKIEGAPVAIRVGYQTLVNGVVNWTPAVTFDPATELYVDLGPIQGRAIALEISSQGQWLLNGYVVEVFPAGKF